MRLLTGETVNKNEYLNQLRQELSGLSTADIEDIIRDQEEYFRDALSNGRSEDQVVSSLGEPSQLAKELKAEYQIKAATREDKFIPKTKNTFDAVLALCVLAPFNLIFVLGPFLGLCGIVISFWTTGISLAGASIAVALAALVTIFMLGPVLGLTIFFGSLTFLGLTLLLLYAMFFVTKWLLQLTVSYLKWNAKFVTQGNK